MSLFGGSTNTNTNQSNPDDKPKESGVPAGGIAQKDFAAMFAKKEGQPTASNGEEAKKPEGTEKSNVFGGLFSAPPKSPAKEEKKDESPAKPTGGLFSGHQGGSLFSNLGSNTGTFTVPSTLGSGLLGGNVTAAPILGGGLFGNAGTTATDKKTEAAPTNADAAATTGTTTNTGVVTAGTTGTTGATASPQKGGGLFNNSGALGGLFGSAGSAPTTGGGLFGGAGLGGGLFANAGATPATATATTGTTGGGLFGGNTGGGTGGGLFGNVGGGTGSGLFGGNAGGGSGGGLFGSAGAGGATGTGGGLFANNSPPKLGAGGLNIGTLKGNAQYVPNLNAPTTGKTGTVNYDLKFGKSNENYEIYSITCASNADKNKSIEELRAEDYELIRTGELPEALQLKIIDNRERLEKNLGFVLPVPTPSNKTYTKIFKSTTRNTSMKSTFMNNKYADVKFKVEMEEIPAHRNVLGLCSPFFDDLFTKHQSDTFPLVIEIPDVKAETFKAILEFLYTGEVNLHEDLAVDLILHGQKFDVMDLVQAADDFISKMINIDNYMKVLEISDRLSSKPLRKKVFTFIVRNMKMISKREDFEELPREFLMEILENAIAA